MDDLRKQSSISNIPQSIYALTRDIVSKNETELEEHNLQVIRENDGDLTSFFKKNKEDKEK